MKAEVGAIDVEGRAVQVAVQNITLRAVKPGAEAMRVQVKVPGYRMAQRIVQPHQLDEPLMMVLPIDPAQATGPPVEEACWMNLVAKMESTWIAGVPVSTFVRKPFLKYQDRTWAEIDRALLRHIRRTGVFDDAPGGLHHAPVDGYEQAGSWKTHDAHGNLQITIFQPHGGDAPWIADLDIDERSGIMHVFECVRNIGDTKTHPYDVHQLLIWHQGIRPAYGLLLPGEEV
jgi:hypothetical protein